MSASQLLSQFLGGSNAGAGPAKGREDDLMQIVQQQLGAKGLGSLLGSGGASATNAGNPLGGILSGGFGKSAVAGGVLGLLLKGGKKPKKMMKSAAKMGGLGLVAGVDRDQKK